MDVETLRAHCAAKPGAWADNPWAHEHPVFKVGEGERAKIFVFLRSDSVGIKGGPSREAADEWLQRFPDEARPMAYIGRSGWNDLDFSGAISDEELLDAVDESYRLVVSRLPRGARPAGWDG
ncbi:MmcQ/YjbR family DNA-binding protein [Nocardioides sp. 616]|uniref:MmcQ/YjbR family DNA-binding protein n=1 Tax=Nocardioides sp. 616 TaxID=2268090 RepID=UPI000CE478A6|nr:MmcQ/YjbR family DNA-binding protein [Nocardioides sp. 616]